MNTKRFVTLLNKAPYVLFTEVDYDKIPENILIVIQKKFNLSNKDCIETMLIKPESSLRGIIKSTTKLADPLAYNIIEALVDALRETPYLDIEANCDWQDYIEWQNVDTKPEPTTHEYTVTVDRITHELNTIYSKNLESSTRAYDGGVNLSSVDLSVPFPKALLKECVADIYEIIKVMSMNREPSTIAKSKYMSVVQTGHETFNWCNLKKIEKDLIAVLKSNNIIIEQ